MFEINLRIKLFNTIPTTQIGRDNMKLILLQTAPIVLLPVHLPPQYPKNPVPMKIKGTWIITFRVIKPVILSITTASFAGINYRNLVLHISHCVRQATLQTFGLNNRFIGEKLYQSIKSSFLLTQRPFVTAGRNDQILEKKGILVIVGQNNFLRSKNKI